MAMSMDTKTLSRAEQECLIIIANSDVMLSARGIVAKSLMKEQVVQRALRGLLAKKYIERTRVTQAYKYKISKKVATGKIQPTVIRGYKPPTTVIKEVKVTVDKSDKPRINISSDSLFKLFQTFALGKWTPKNQKLQDNLPISLARLYRAAAEVFVEGSTVTQEELSAIRRDIIDYLNSLETAAITVSSILEKREIWDQTKFAEFLMSVEMNPMTIRELTYEVEDKQR